MEPAVTAHLTVSSQQGDETTVEKKRLEPHPIINPAASFDLPKHDRSLVSKEIKELPEVDRFESFHPDATVMGSRGGKEEDTMLSSSTKEQPVDAYSGADHTMESQASELKVRPPPQAPQSLPSGPETPAPSLTDDNALQVPTTPDAAFAKQYHHQQQQDFSRPPFLAQQQRPQQQQKHVPHYQPVQGSFDIHRMDAAAAVQLARDTDISTAFASLPKVKPRWTHHYMKLLLVGENGLGRTTFVRNLFAAYAEDPKFPVADASSPTARRRFIDQPETLCTELVVQDPETMVVWHYLVQDTPGYGDLETVDDLESDRQMILEHVLWCSQRYFEQEVDPGRRDALNCVIDTRVDVCLFFLPPHRLRKMDVRFIKQLSTHVPVIPILAKADTMTPDELNDFKAAVRKALMLQPSGGDDYSPTTGWQFDAETLAAAGAPPSGPPYAVIGSNTVDASVGRFWPVRKYPWGRCESLLTAHSDLPALRRLLFETGYWELKAHTEATYLEFRKRECGARGNVVPKPFRGLMKLVFGTVAGVVGAFLIVNAPPYLRSEVYRKEAVRRVKAKVGDAVETALDTVQDVSSRAEEVGKVAKETGSSVWLGTKHAVKQTARALESEAAKRQREEEERRSSRGWFRFWG